MKVRLPNSNMKQQDMLNQIQKMQDDAAALQADLDVREYSASSGGGLVNVVVNGKLDVLSIKISEPVDDNEMLEDLLIVALNEAIANARTTSEEEMSAVTSGLQIPGL